LMAPLHHQQAHSIVRYAVAVALALIYSQSVVHAQTGDTVYQWNTLTASWLTQAQATGYLGAGAVGSGTPPASGSSNTFLEWNMLSNPYQGAPNYSSMAMPNGSLQANQTYTLNGFGVNMTATSSGSMLMVTPIYQTGSGNTIYLPTIYNLSANSGNNNPTIVVSGTVSNNLGASFGYGNTDYCTEFMLTNNTTIQGSGSGLLGFSADSWITGSGSLTINRTGTGAFAYTYFGPSAFNTQYTGTAATGTSEPTNTYTGGTNILLGVVIVGTATTAGGSALGTGSLTLGQSGTSTATLAANAVAYTTYNGAALNIAGSVTFGYIAPGGIGAQYAGSSVAVFPVNLGSGSGTISLSSSTSPTLTTWGGELTTLATAVSGSVGMIKDGWGTLVLSVSNSYTGNTQVNLGLLELSSASAMGSTGSLVFNGGWIQNTTSSALSVANAVIVQNNVNIAGTQGFTFSSTSSIDLGQSGGTPVFNIVASTSATTFNAPLVNNESSTGGLFKTGAGTLVLTAAATYAGATTISPLPPSGSSFGLPLINANGTYPTGGGGGQITLNANGAFAGGNAGVTIVGAGANSTGATTAGTLLLDNTATNVSNRLGGSSVPLDLQGGTFQVIGNHTTSSTESFGALTVDAGASTINLSIAGTSPTTNLQVTAASLTRSNYGVLNLLGTTVGTAAAGTNDVSSLLLTSATTVTSALVGGGGAIGSTTISIVPWVAGENATGTAIDTLVTYTPTYGFHPLTTSEYATISSGTTTTNNVLVTSGLNLTTTTTINSLNFGATATIGAPGPLVVTSGAVLVQSTFIGTISAALVAGSSGSPTELVILGPGSLALSGAVTANGLTIGSTGTVTLGAANPSLTGNIVLDSGTLVVTAASQFGTATNVYFQGGTLKFSQASGDVSLSTTYTVGAPGGSISLLTLGATQTLTGSLAGSGALNLTGVVGTNLVAPSAFNFAGDNSGFTGTVVLSVGALNLNSANSGGNNAGNTSTGYGLTLASGTLLGASGSVAVSVPGTVTLLPSSTTAASFMIGGTQNINLATVTSASFVLPTPSAGGTGSSPIMSVAIDVLNPAVTATIAGTVSTSPTGTSNTTVNGYQTTGLTTLNKQGPGALVFSQAVALSGNLGNVGGGSLAFNGNLAIGGTVADGAAAVTLYGGPTFTTGTITFNGTTTLTAGQLISNFGVVNFAGPATLNGITSGTLADGSIISNWSQITFTGATASIGGDITLNGGLLNTSSATAVTGVGTIGLTNGAAATFNTGGPTMEAQLQSGSLTITGTATLGTAGATATLSQVLIGATSTLTLNNSTTNINARFANGATGTLYGTALTPNFLYLAGQLIIQGNATAATPTLEPVGEILQNATGYQGMGTLTLVPAGANETRAIVSAFGTYTSGASYFFQGFNLGNATALAASSGVPSSRITFVTSPTLYGAGAVGTTTVGILPIAFGYDTNTMQYGFLTYDTTSPQVNGAVLGLRPLNASTEYASTFTAATATTNVNLTSTTSLTTSTIGSLLIGGGGGISGGTTLTVDSGAILAANGANNGITIGTLTLTGATGYLTGVITAVNNLTLNGNLTTTAGTTAGLIKDGPGTFTLNGSLTLGTTTSTSTLFINEGTFALMQNNAINSTNNVQIAPSGFLNLNGTSQTFTNLISPGYFNTTPTYIPTGGGGVLLPGSSSLTVMSATAATTFDGFLFGPGSFTQNGTGDLTLTRFSPITGSVNITAGTLSLYVGPGELANTTVTLNGGTLILGGISAPSAPALGATAPPLPGGGQVSYFSYLPLNVGANGGIFAPAETYTDEATISSTGAGTLTKSSNTSLFLQNANSTYTGATSLVVGSLWITASVLNNTNSPLGNSTSTIYLDPSSSTAIIFYWGANLAVNAGQNRNFLIDRPISLSGATGTGTVTINFYGNPVLTANSSGIDLAGKTLIIGASSSTTTFFAPIISSVSGGVVSFSSASFNGNVNFWSGSSTYNGGTTFAVVSSSTNDVVSVGLGASSTGSITSGPLGTGTLTIPTTTLAAAIYGLSFHADNPSSPYTPLATAGLTLANPISVTNTNAAEQLNLTGINNLTLSGTIAEPSTATTTFTVGAANVQQNLTLSGVVTSPGTGAQLVKAGAGILTLTNSGNASTIGGSWTLSAGTLAFASDADLGPSGSAILVSAAGTALNLTGSVTSSRTITYSGATGSLTFDAAPSTASTFSGAINQGSNVLSIIKNDTGTLTLSGGGTMAGTATVNNGALNLTTQSTTVITGYVATGPGSALNVSGTTSPSTLTATLIANVGGTVTLNNSANTSSYITYAKGAVTLNGGTLAVSGTSGSATNSQTIGAVSVTANTASTISLTANGSSSNSDPLILAGTTLTAGLGANSVLLIAGSNLGGTNGASAQATFTTAPTLSATFAASSPTCGIVAAVIGDITPTGNGSGFVTYGSSGGVVLLSSSQYLTGTTITAGDNVQLTGSSSISTGTSVNSLYLQNAASASTLNVGNVALTLTSGMLLVNNTSAGNPSWSITGSGSSAALATPTSVAPVLWVSTGSSLTLGVPITPGTATSGVDKGGGGTLVLANTTGSGSTMIFNPSSAAIFAINGGTVQVGQTGNVFGTNVTVEVGPGATFDLNGYSQTIVALVSPTATLLNSFTGALATNSFGSVTLESANSLTPTLTVTGAATTYVFNGVMSGQGGFTITGGGTTTFYAPQTYIGATTIQSGTLAFGALGSSTTQLLASTSIVLGTSSANTNAALSLLSVGAGLGLPYTFGTSSQTLTVDAVPANFGQARTFNANSGASSVYTNPATQLSTPLDSVGLNIALNDTASLPARLTITGSAILTGSISDNGMTGGSLAFSGTTNWFMTAASTYTGGTVVLGSGAATFGLGNSTALGTGPVTVGVSQAGVAATTATSLTLLSLMPSGQSLTVSNPINFSSTVAATSDLTVTGLSDLDLSGLINLNTSSTSVGRTLTISNFGTTTFGGGLTSTGPVSQVTKNGTGLLVLSADSPSLTTSWLITAGVVQIMTSNGLGAAGNAVTVTNTAAASAGTLELNGAGASGGGLTVGTTFAPSSLTIGGQGYTDQGALHNVSGNNTWNGPVTLTGNYSNMDTAIGVDPGSSLTINGSVTTNVTTLLPVIFTKFGTGALTINGNLSNTGQTFVNAGTLYVNGTITAGDLLIVQQSAGLGGSATINRTVTFETGASINPGAAGSTPGTLTFNNNVSFVGGFTYNWRVSNGTSSDLVVVSSNSVLSFNPLEVVDVKINDLTQSGPTQSSYLLFDPASSITGFNAANWIVDTSGLSNANAAMWSGYIVSQVGNTIVLANAAVPEPNAPLAWSAAIAGAIFLLRRRNARLQTLTTRA
jgi:fibronectin-binding autotransporter adhesin